MKLWSPVVSAKAWIFSCGTSIHEEGPNSAPASIALMAGPLRDLEGRKRCVFPVVWAGAGRALFSSELRPEAKTAAQRRLSRRLPRSPARAVGARRGG